jgi:hypothetical protein
LALLNQQDLLISISGIGMLKAAKLLGETMQAFSSARNLTIYAGLNPQHQPPAHPSMLDRAYPRSATPIFEKHCVFLTLKPNASSPFSGHFVHASNNAMNTR